MIVRQASLSGVANRYVDLPLPRPPQKIADGGATPGRDHLGGDLDQIFNAFDPESRKDPQVVAKCSENRQGPGRG